MLVGNELIYWVNTLPSCFYCSSFISDESISAAIIKKRCSRIECTLIVQDDDRNVDQQFKSEV